MKTYYRQQQRPLEPDFVLRMGGSACEHVSITASSFIHVRFKIKTMRCSIFLLSGDSDGRCVVWDLSTYRPIVKWQAHSKSVLCVAPAPANFLRDVEATQIITQGRDDCLHVWDLAPILRQLVSNEDIDDSDTDAIHKDTLIEDGKQNDERCQIPTLVYTLPISSLNFCRFDAMLQDDQTTLIAVPNIILSTHFDIFNITTKTPIIRRVGLDIDSLKTTGLCMTIRFLSSHNSGRSPDQLSLIVGYESGDIMLWKIGNSASDSVADTGAFCLVASPLYGS